MKSWLIALVVMGIVGVACGDTSSTTASATATPTSAATPTATPATVIGVVASPAAGPSEAPTATPPPTPTPTPTATPVPPAPVASFTLSQTSGQAPLLVQFTNTSEGEFDEIAWEIGADISTGEDSPRFPFTEARSYTVGLTVSGPGGSDTVVLVDAFTVEPGPAVDIRIRR